MSIDETLGYPIHAFFKGAGALILVGGALAEGFLERAPITIASVAFAWCVAKLGVNWRAWSRASKASESTSFLRLLATALVIQIALVAVLYGIGRWLGTLSTIEMPSETFEGIDWLILAILMTVAVPLRIFGGKAVEFAVDTAASGV